MNDPDKLTRFIHDLGEKASLIDSTKSTSKNVLRDGKKGEKKRKSNCNIVDREVVPFSGPKILSFAARPIIFQTFIFQTFCISLHIIFSTSAGRMACGTERYEKRGDKLWPEK